MTMRFEGTVTQSGVMDDGHRFRAVQGLVLELNSDNAYNVECTIERTEREKYIDDTRLLSPDLPLPLQQYLSSFGSSLSHAVGRWHRAEGLLRLEEAAPPTTLTPSDVTWSRHAYMLLLDGSCLSGVAINLDEETDRTNDKGLLRARLVRSGAAEQVVSIPLPPNLQRMALRLPVSVYRFDPLSKQYVFQACHQFTVPQACATMPRVLTSRSGQCLLRENMELLKLVMRAPAVMLQKGARVKIYNVACEEVASLPPTEPVRVLRAYELPYLNVETQIAHYRLRGDGALVLVDTGRIQCAMCHIPDSIKDLEVVREHLRSRRNLVRKLLRDRRIVVEMGDGRTSVYSCETLQLGKRVE